MQAHILSLHTSSAPRVGSKDQIILFSEEPCLVTYPIKGNGA